VPEISITQNIRATNYYLWVDGVFPNCEKAPPPENKKAWSINHIKICNENYVTLRANLADLITKFVHFATEHSDGGVGQSSDKVGPNHKA
jgi:hypothetical protein